MHFNGGEEVYHEHPEEEAVGSSSDDKQSYSPSSSESLLPMACFSSSAERKFVQVVIRTFKKEVNSFFRGKAPSCHQKTTFRTNFPMSKSKLGADNTVSGLEGTLQSSEKVIDLLNQYRFSPSLLSVMLVGCGNF